jgi:hypothetical protein
MALMILITARILVKKKVSRGHTLGCVHAKRVTDADPFVHPAWFPHVDLPPSVCRLPNNPWSVVQISNLCYHPPARCGEIGCSSPSAEALQ